MDLGELFDYKNKLMEDLCKNPEIVRLVTENKDATVPNHQLPYTQLYPFEFVPESLSGIFTPSSKNAGPDAADVA